MTERRRAEISGVVQGVGFRPFVVRLAKQYRLVGFVQNCNGCVSLEIEGPRAALDQFANELTDHIPAPAEISAIRWQSFPPSKCAPSDFTILASTASGNAGLVTAVDLAPCANCLSELTDPANRRYRHPFINCVACGPRFSIIESPPFDRSKTAMKEFEPCEACAAEFNDIGDRRFHAQGICCPACGPELTFSNRRADSQHTGATALEAAVQTLKAGRILALKGVGGYQLVVDANNADAIQQLRERKRRSDKPFALMCANLTQARRFAEISDAEACVLSQPAAPILLLRAGGQSLPNVIAPGNPMLGIMLPASPLHLLLANGFDTPLVVTSGNLHGETIICDDAEAFAKLGNIADAVLHHNRRIVHAVDDSVVQITCDKPQVLRLARGLAPLSIDQSGYESTQCILATGGHLKQTPVLSGNKQTVCWPQVGDLDSLPARLAMSRSLSALPQFLNRTADVLATDMHPDYATSIWAERDGRPILTVQHHHAHVAACLSEHGIGEALGVAWDGSGYGLDGQSWGGEFLAINKNQCERVASLRPFALPGGDKAARNGWRVVAGLCTELEKLPDDVAKNIACYQSVIEQTSTRPKSSSIGRLFDAVAALCGLCEHPTFEGQAAMAVQHAATAGANPYSFEFAHGQLDWRPMLPELIADRHHSKTATSRFHATLRAMILAVIDTVRPRTVALCGGCFQNKLLLEDCHIALTERGIIAIYPQRLPPGDGGLALGQSWVASHRLSQTNPLNQVTCV